MSMSRIPKLSDNPTDIGDRYMVARHRKNILEQLGVARDEIPNKADDQIIMLKAFKIEKPDMYIKLFDLYVRGIQPDSDDGKVTLEAKSAVIEQQKKEAMSEIRAVGSQAVDEIDHRASNVSRNIEQKFNSVFIEHAEKIGQIAFAAVEQASQKLIKVEHVFKVAEKPEVVVEDILPDEFEKVLHLAANRVNVLLVGPSGCGKTHISAIVAKVLGIPYYGQSCSAGMSESIFAGWLLPIGDNGKFSYVESPFIKAYENGGVFLFDEIDAADGNTLLFLNQSLAQDHFFLPQRFENPLVKKHKDFVAIAAANTYGAGANSLYNSRNALDAASMDRFRMGTVEMDYSEKVELKLIDRDVLSIGRLIRHLINSRSLRKILSTRFMLDATKMKKAGWSLKDIFDSYSKDWSKEEKKLLSDAIDRPINELSKQDKSPDEMKKVLEGSFDEEEFTIGDKKHQVPQTAKDWGTLKGTTTGNSVRNALLAMMASQLGMSPEDFIKTNNEKQLRDNFGRPLIIDEDN